MLQRILITALMLFICASHLQAQERFTDNKDGTMTDRQTGLMWVTDDNGGDIIWQDAKLYANSFLLKGYTNWRMPTIEELRTLFDETLTTRDTLCGEKVKLPPLIEATCGMFWAADVCVEQTCVFHFGYGRQYARETDEARRVRVLPVREVEVLR